SCRDVLIRDPERPPGALARAGVRTPRRPLPAWGRIPGRRRAPTGGHPAEPAGWDVPLDALPQPRLHVLRRGAAGRDPGAPGGEVVGRGSLRGGAARAVATGRAAGA